MKAWRPGLYGQFRGQNICTRYQTQLIAANVYLPHTQLVTSH